MSDNITENIETDLTPAEINARHARHLLERALSMLEGGDPDAAALSIKQALHLAPESSHAHSIAGLLALLREDWKVAAEHYEQAIENFDEGSTERERLIALRTAEANPAARQFANFVPDLSNEILRLREIVHAAPIAAFVSENVTHTTSLAEARVLNTGVLNTRESILQTSTPQRDDDAGSTSETQRWRRSPAVAVAVASAVVAAVLGFIITRSIRSAQQPATATNTAVVTDANSNTATVPPNIPTENAVTSAGTDVANAVMTEGAPPAAEQTNAQTAAPTPRVTPAPGAAPPPGNNPSVPRLPQPAISPKGRTPSTVTPRPTPARPVPTPTPPSEPPMPRLPPPRITLPNADRSGPPSEEELYPRVVPLPPGRDDQEESALPRFGTQ